jgi:ribosomal protein S18 acetylase RimI-like enzyme
LNDGWRGLDRLKNDFDTRHIPVQVISVEEEQLYLVRKPANGAVSNGNGFRHHRSKEKRSDDAAPEVFDPAKAQIDYADNERGAINKLLHAPGLGEIYLIFRGNEMAGYFALTFCFSLEFHGRFAFLDEVYLREAYRRQKLGKAVVAFAEDLCKKAGIRALRLEVGRENQPAQSLYRAAGFEIAERNLMTKWL